MTKNRLANVTVRAGMSLAVVPLVFAGLAGHSGQRAQADPGIVSGRLELVGGPSPGRTFPVPGLVTARRPGGGSVTVHANKHGWYWMSLAPGRYKLTGHPAHSGGHLTCYAPHPVTVRADKVVKHVDVVCPVP